MTHSDREYLRALAGKQREYAEQPIMAQREKLWRAHNDLKGDRPLFTFENWIFPIDGFTRQLQCEDPNARAIESILQNSISAHELIDDDRVIPAFLPLYYDTWFVPFGIDVVKQQTNDLAYHTQTVIQDLEDDFYKLGKSRYGYRKDKVLQLQTIAEEAFGDVLPVKVMFPTRTLPITQHLVNLMGMENLMFALYDFPEELEKMLIMLTDDYLEYLNFLESENVLTLNNGNQYVNQGSWGFSDEMSVKNGRVGTKDLWFFMDAQETVGISPQMFKDHFFPFYYKVAQRFARLNYGCCEPIHPVWDDCVSKFENLRKVSISAWCNEEIMGEKLRGKPVIYHRKPSPNYICLGTQFDEDAFENHIKKTLEAAKGCKLEFSFRDIYSLQGDATRFLKASAIVRKCIERYW